MKSKFMRVYSKSFKLFMARSIVILTLVTVGGIVFVGASMCLWAAMGWWGVLAGWVIAVLGFYFVWGIGYILDNGWNGDA